MKLPFVSLAQVQEIVKTYPTPFHLYDEKGIRENIRRMKQAFSWNKGFQEYYAVKAAATPGLLQIFKEEGFGLDCSSYTELMLADALGFCGKDIIFSSNCTPPEDFLYAHKLGALINLDDYSDIDTISGLFSPLPETICCRFNPGGYFAIGNDIMDHPKDAKYGFTKPQLFEGFRRLKAMGVKHFGLHAFLASNTVTNEYYPALAKLLFELAVELQEQTGAHINLIDLSGGVGIPYHPGQTGNDIAKIGAGVQQAYEEILVKNGMGDVAIVTELGRFMTGPYGCLIAQATHEKKTHKDYIGLDACAVNLMRPAMYGAYHHITVLGKENAPADHIYDITGGLCENNDKFAIDRPLPKIDIGDYLCIHDTGAHGFSMGYNYNGKLKSAELLLKEDGSVEMIRRAETPQDYFATLDFLHLFDPLPTETLKGAAKMHLSSYSFRRATSADSSALLSLYRSLVGTPGCTWNEFYPGIEEISADLASASLYCLCAPDGAIVAAASAGPDDELSHLSWSPELTNFCELARVCVRKELQNLGLGSYLLQQVISSAQQKGFDDMRMLVSRSNLAALALYEKAGFSRLGQTRMYDIDFYCYQLKL